MSSSSQAAFIQEGSGHSLTEVVLDDITNPDGDSSIPSRSDVQREDTITAIVTGEELGLMHRKEELQQSQFLRGKSLFSA